MTWAIIIVLSHSLTNNDDVIEFDGKICFKLRLIDGQAVIRHLDLHVDLKGVVVGLVNPGDHGVASVGHVAEVHGHRINLLQLKWTMEEENEIIFLIYKRHHFQAIFNEY